MNDFLKYTKHFNFTDVIFRDPIFLIASVIILLIFIPKVITYCKESEYGKLFVNSLIVTIVGFGIATFSVMLYDYNVNAVDGFEYSKAERNSAKPSNSYTDTVQDSTNSKFEEPIENQIGEYSSNNGDLTVNWASMRVNPSIKESFPEFHCLLDNKTNEKVIKILSEINPNSAEEGKFCGTLTKKCKWCGRDFESDSFKETAQKRIQNLLVTNSMVDDIDVQVNNSMEVNEIVKKYGAGDFYACVNDYYDTFCSSKCKSEFR